MKNKIFSILMAGLLVLPLAGLISGTGTAFADNEHGKKVSEAARENKETRGEHGFYVSSIARQNNGHDDEGDEDENDNDNNNERDEHGSNVTSTPTSTPEIINNNSLQALERFIAFLQQQIQVLIERLNQFRGGIVAPVISSVSASSIATSSATISWVTNVAGTSKVYLSTSSPVILASASVVSDLGLVTNHSFNLPGLNASTTYYFVVESVNASSSVIRSAQLSFNTLSVAAPVISVISVSGISSSTATISWTTDTLSTSKVYFSTSTPVNVLSAQTASSSALVTSHLIVLTGLSANTNYYFVIESVDVISNVSRSSQFSFLTTL